MWSDRIWFLSGSLSAIGICISICVARHIGSLSNHEYAKDTRIGTNKFLQLFFKIICVFILLFVIFLVGYLIYNMYSVYRDYPFDAGDAMLSILVGAAFGTFVTRFVWALFGPGLGATEAVMGVGVFVLLSIGYSLPVYYRHLWLLLQSSGIGITSVKLPGAEITFADHGRQVAGVGAKANETVGNSGVPRPSDPRPGLDFLDADVQQTAFPKRDKEYIEGLVQNYEDKTVSFKIRSFDSLSAKMPKLPKGDGRGSKKNRSWVLEI